ncbi:MAG: ribosomal-protein-alanine N-acetyltransferase [Clostridiales bacterium]|nr:ribosomal-protein-alanine N-acetyltransferase [Clostridiales bacterium]
MIRYNLLSYRDADAIYPVEYKCFPSPWSQAELKKDMAEKNRIYLGAFDEEVAVGYIGMMCFLDEAHILNVAVLPEYRRQGIAQELLEEAIATAKSKGAQYAYLEVRVSNTPAINLYKKYGFYQIGLRKEYYSDNLEDALTMVKML